MKTQISRYSHNTKKHYSGVYQQQGRMITDADWNALVDVTKERIARALENIIGSGVPRNMALEIFDDAGTNKIKPGHVVVNGILAQLEGDPSGLEFDAQPDFPLPGGVEPGANTKIYADVWERAVVSLEDDELRDPGLHGADTCSRTQTMLQLKWCADSFNPEDDAINNPQIGNAELEVSLPDFAADVSQADPCLTEAVDQPRIGDYLFRLEVHKLVLSQDGPTTTATVTLKWSSENGAEHYGLLWRNQDGVEQRNTSQLPPEFASGNWIYEFYTDSSEKHLGKHLSTDYDPLYGVLQSDLNNIPTVGSAQADYVRRWDGYIEFSMSRTPGQPWTPDSGSVTGIEKGQNIQLDPTQVPAHAWFSDDGGNAALDLVLQGLILKLNLNDYNFVSGDYWLAVVREGAAFYQGIAVDERVRRLNDGLPLGVKHHYLTLAELDGSGVLVPYESGSAKDRQLDFPPLSNLTADRVGYDPSATQSRWEDIKEATPTVLPNTVQEAIDDLVNNLESSDVGYTLPSCGVNQSVMNLLATIPGWPDLDGDTRTTIKDMINGLLCHLDAGTIPYTTAAAETLDDVILNKLTGGDITGDLSVSGNTTVGGNSSVAGMTITTRFRMTDGVSGTPQQDYVLTSEDANGNASWKPAPGASWQLQADGDLVTDPVLVTKNVGIDTESPAAKFHVKGSTMFGDAFNGGVNNSSNIVNILVGENNNGDQNGISFYENTSIYGMKMGYDGTATGDDNAIRFYNNDNDAVFSINNGGNIGLGIDAPSYALHINKPLVNGFSVGPGGDSGRIWTDYIGAGPSLNFYDWDDYGTIRFRESPNTNNESSPEFEALISGRRGNIGINTTDPRASLHVNGRIYATGAIFSNPVLAYRQATNTIARSASSYGAIPDLNATLHVPTNTTVTLTFYFASLQLNFGGDADFRVITDQGVNTFIASFNPALGLPATYNNQTFNVSLNLVAGANVVTLQWREPGGSGTATLVGLRSMRISV